jgi:hypothetical protein
VAPDDFEYGLREPGLRVPEDLDREVAGVFEQ